MIIYVSAWLAGRGDNVKNFWLGFFPCVLLVGFVAGLVMLEPDLGTTMVLVLTTLTLVFVAGASLTHVLACGGIVGVAGSMLVLSGGYRTDRSRQIEGATSGVSAGIGLTYRFFTFDFSWIPFGNLGNNFRYSVRLRF